MLIIICISKISYKNRAFIAINALQSNIGCPIPREDSSPKYVNNLGSYEIISLLKYNFIIWFYPVATISPLKLVKYISCEESSKTVILTGIIFL